jgi:hypothetical protein
VLSILLLAVLKVKEFIDDSEKVSGVQRQSLPALEEFSLINHSGMPPLMHQD